MPSFAPSSVVHACSGRPCEAQLKRQGFIADGKLGHLGTVAFSAPQHTRSILDRMALPRKPRAVQPRSGLGRSLLPAAACWGLVHQEHTSRFSVYQKKHTSIITVRSFRPGSNNVGAGRTADLDVKLTSERISPIRFLKVVAFAPLGFAPETAGFSD